ncbi:ankyrin repeat and SOCS box protein 16-like [Lepeophtheirus salmonis]|uniref:ankyrin repeat and SOCS box protein 16-like n=1 Tax=Lepeophtheirus salmonis TaxID=72036 RepID=UPI003AF3EFAD
MEGIEVEQLPLSQTRSKDLANLIIDFDDESCQNYDLHLSAYQGEHERLKYLLQDQDIKSHINDRIRPYLSTPLRLAATAGHLDSLRVLIENGASLEAVDVKSQTALFTALVNRHWDCVEYLLSVGANPNGNDQNLCTPLSVMAQRGYYEGIKLLCTWGADTEDFYRLLSGLPLSPSNNLHNISSF